MQPRRVLVLGNAADRSGAPVALLRLMRWCVSRDLVEPTFVLRSGGELIDEYRALGGTFLLSEGREHKAARALRVLPGGEQVVSAGKLALAAYMRELCRRRRIEVIYANTAIHARPISWLAPLGLPVVTHFHELTRWLEHLGVADTVPRLISQTRWCLAVSDAVRRMLIDFGADERTVLDAPAMLGEVQPPSAADRARIRREILDVDEDVTVIAACGFPSLIKGADLFVRLAQKTLALHDAAGGPPVAFRWIGADPDNELTKVIVEDARRTGVSERVRTIPRVEDAASVLGSADVFLCGSREEAMPLSGVEAAVSARPIVCFEATGGVQEIVDAGGAVAVPYLDIDAMAQSLRALVVSPAERRRLGESGREFVVRRHSPDVVGELTANLFQNLIDAGDQGATAPAASGGQTHLVLGHEPTARGEDGAVNGHSPRDPAPRPTADAP